MEELYKPTLVGLFANQYYNVLEVIGPNIEYRYRLTYMDIEQALEIYIKSFRQTYGKENVSYSWNEKNISAGRPGLLILEITAKVPSADVRKSYSTCKLCAHGVCEYCRFKKPQDSYVDYAVINVEIGDQIRGACGACGKPINITEKRNGICSFCSSESDKNIKGNKSVIKDSELQAP